VEQAAKSLYAVAVSEPDATSKWRAFGWTLIKALLLADAADPYWRVEVIHLPSSKVVLSWKESREGALALKEILDRDLAALDPQAFEGEWNVERPQPSENT
jgi:hypothetical protein